MRYLFFSLVFTLLSTSVTGKPYYFRHYRIDNGLPNNTVMDCIQDTRGFMWFGTKEGLARFDGYQFKIFLNNPSAKNCIISNFITALAEDRDGWIWIGTPEGICYYLPDNDYFEIPLLADSQSIKEMILDVQADHDNIVWIATYRGLYKYNKKSGETEFFSSAQNFIPRSITVTGTGEVWISSLNGKIYNYIVRTNSFTSYTILNEKELMASVRQGGILDAGEYGLIISTDIDGLRHFNPNTGVVEILFANDTRLRNAYIRTTFLNDPQEIWIGTESGIYIYNLISGFVKNLTMVNTDPFSISNNAIRRIIKDREGGIWVATFYGGVNYLPHESKFFEKYYPTGEAGSLNGNVVREIREDSYGNIWIGTEDAGLIKLDRKTGYFSSVTADRNNVRIGSRNVQGILVDGSDLWIGTYDDGIYILSIPEMRIRKHFKSDDRSSGLRTNSVITFLKTHDGTVYAGTAFGIYQYLRETGTFSYLTDVAAGTFIHALFEASDNTVWVGTYGRGLYKFDRQTGLCRKILSEKGDYEKLRNEYITSIFEDNQNRIWFTTEGNGFCSLNLSNEEIVRYIPGSNIEFSIYCAMLQDNSGHLWITSTRGLLRFDPATGEYVTFTKDDGLLDNTFSYNSAFKDKDGKMFFGTMKGLISFFPEEIKETSYSPPVFLTGLQINGREYFTNPEGSKENKSSLIADHIKLKHYNSSFSIDFVSPTFTYPNQTKYKYIMEGADSDWIVISGNRKVYYTNMAPGRYRFKVLSSTDGKAWSPEPAILNIRITPPLWLSGPAYAVYALILLSVIYTILSFYSKKKALEQQRKIDLLETNREREILNAKINFFTNITHEVRTPLTLIKGPLERILKNGLKNVKDTEENLLIIKRNTDRLLNLINQLLDFRKTEKEMLKLSLIKADLHEVIESAFNMFLPYSTERMISLQFHSPVKQYYFPLDKEIITKIISNLLSNAIKFAALRVDLYLETETGSDKYIRIRVNSDGQLIPSEHREKIFEPFFQLDFEKPGEKGTGLGLSLARSLAELHHGRLYLDTNVKGYNSFVLELEKEQEVPIQTETGQQENDQVEPSDFDFFGTHDNLKPNILLVEDEVEMGRFIAKELSADYNVILVYSGMEALKALKKYNITLIVSDVIMPVMNGYQLCRQVKSDIEYSHIPVILLTATIHLNAKIEGLDAGADAYIEKPFSTDLLLAQIANLIKNRSLDRQNFINTPLAHFKTVAMNKTDEEFLKKLHGILMENISENDLSVEKIADLMGISVSTLYRKVKALTDLNTVEYIRFARLKKAAELLSEGNYRINEISYLVGFSSPSYFATSFQKQFGISPSQFIRKLK